MAFLIRVNYDNNTEILYDWANDIIKQCSKKIRRKIQGKRVSHRAIKRELSGKNGKKYKYVIFYGHGSEDGNILFGDKHSPLIEFQDYRLLKKLKGKIVYAVACYSAKGIGFECIHKKYVLGYFGYVNCLKLPPKNEKHSLGYKAFKETTNAGILALLKGTPPEKIYNEVMQVYMEHYDFLVESRHYNTAKGIRENMLSFRYLPPRR